MRGIFFFFNPGENIFQVKQEKKRNEREKEKHEVKESQTHGQFNRKSMKKTLG